MDKTKKLTYKEVITKVLEMEEVKANIEYMEVLTKLLKSLEKKSQSRTKQATEEQETIMKEILKVLETTDKATITQVWGKSTLLQKYTTNKISAMMTKLKNEEDPKVIRTVEKKVAYFSLTR